MCLFAYGIQILVCLETTNFGTRNYFRPMTDGKIANELAKLRSNMELAVLGKPEVVKLVVVALLAGNTSFSKMFQGWQNSDRKIARTKHRGQIYPFAVYARLAPERYHG